MIIGQKMPQGSLAQKNGSCGVERSGLERGAFLFQSAVAGGRSEEADGPDRLQFTELKW